MLGSGPGGDHLIIGIGFHWLVNKRDKRVESGSSFFRSACSRYVSCRLSLRFLSWGVVDIGWLPASFPSPRWVLNNPTVGSCLCCVQAMTLGDEVRPAIIIMGYKYGLLLLLVDSKMATDRCHKVGG